MAKTFTVATKSTFLEPYWQALSDGSRPEIEYTDKQTYRKLSKEAAILVLKEFFDVPEKEMTLDYVKKEFGRSDNEMSDGTASKIVAYYNGRKTLYDELMSMLDDDFEQAKIYIPKELNSFTTIENDEEFEKTQQLEAWVEVRVED